MKYVSTRGQVEPVGFRRAVRMGLADDGGLLIPEAIPDVSGRMGRWAEADYAQLACEIFGLFVKDICAEDLRCLVEQTYGEPFDPAPAPLVQVGGLWVLELWHGPTLAFKDIALQWLGRLFEYILAAEGGLLNVLAATSGDTGSAAICGLRGRRGVRVFVMHPRGAVSPIQERQMTTVLDANVHNLAVEGTFDDCQRIMKDLAADLEFKHAYSIGAVNSVNWARVLAQIVYYVHAALRVRRRTGAAGVRFCVPTGNFGNILAGWYAMKLGAPIAGLILATNRNNILERFFNTGVYAVGQVHRTLSPSMDIQVASNFERYLYYLLGSDPRALRAEMEQFARTGRLAAPTGSDGRPDPDIAAGMADEQQTLETIARTWREHGYLLDPHTAVGVSVARRCADAGGEPVVCLATAHPAKFPEAIRRATGEDLARHPAIDALMDLPTRCTIVPNDRRVVRQFLVDTVG